MKQLIYMVCLYFLSNAVFADQVVLDKGEKKMVKIHSAEYFDEQRNYWWNQDFLQLMGKRWKIENVQKVLDVGCGVGHWSFTLGRILPEGALLTGVDREEVWVKKATESAKTIKDRVKYQFLSGDVYQLPFKDASFDMVTCQTVLIHVADVHGAVKEMMRVLKPGGILVLIEPNNISRALTLSSLNNDLKVEEIVEAVSFQLICEKGKKLVGEGYISCGDQLPGVLAELGMKHIDVYMSDKTKMFIPPYMSAEQKSYVEALHTWDESHFWIWSKADTQRYYIAGGGDEAEFEQRWEGALNRQNTQVLAALRNKTYSTAGGKITYCISARKQQ